METSNTPPNNAAVNIGLMVLVVAFWVIASIFVYFNGPDWFMAEAASVEADAVDQLFAFMLAIGTFIFLLVETALVFLIVRYGFMRRQDDETDGPPIHGNNTLEIIWTLIPSIIVFILTVYSFQVLVDTTEARDDEFEVVVTGQQFFWQFEYPNPVEGEDIQLTQNHVLVLPEGETVRLNMETLDVMHAFWVPAFRVKNDLLPGRTTELRFTPNEITGLPDTDEFELVTLDDLDIPGPDTACPTDDAAAAETEDLLNNDDTTAEAEAVEAVAEAEAEEAPPVDYEEGYDIVCAELCGGNHGLMRGEVFVVEREVYDAYLETLRARAIANQAQQDYALRCGGEAIRETGENLFYEYGCNTCHQLDAAGQLSGGQGPSLNNLAADAATRPGYDDPLEYVIEAIVNPNAYIVDGYPANLMPANFADRMTSEEIELLSAYLLLVSEE